jgi:hypothetical protein
MTERGLIESVTLTTLGAYVAAGAALGATSIVVDSALDFDEGGGHLTLNGVTYEYATVDFDTDPDTDTISGLSPALAGAAVEGDRVDISPTVAELTADVMVEHAEDAMTVLVPHSLMDRVPEGLRPDGAGEVVLFDELDNRWVVIDVLGREPVIDGSFIDPDTIPEPSPSDGVPPATAPTITLFGGPGFFSLRWTAVVNADLVTYKVYAGTASGFALDSAHLIARTGSTSMTVRALAGPDPMPGEDDERRLAFDTTYYFVVVPSDDDGDGPASSEASGQMTKTDGTGIAPESVTTAILVAGAVDADKLAGRIVMANTFATADAGQRIEFDSPTGFRAIASDNSILFRVPTVEGEELLFDGEAVIRGMRITGGATFESTENEIARDAGVTMTAGTTPPSAAPTAQIEWDQIPLEIIAETDELGTFALNPNEVIGAAWDAHENVFRISQLRPGGSRLWRYNPDGSFNSLVFDVPGWTHTSFTRVGAASYDFFKYAGDSKFYIAFIHAGDFFFNEYVPQNAARIPVIGQDPSGNLIVAETLANNTLRVARVNVQTTTPHGPCTLVSAVAAQNTKLIPGNLTSIYMGNFDYGGGRIVTAQLGTAFDIWVANQTTSGGQYPWIVNEQWPSPTANKRGVIWDGTQFWTLGSNGVLYKHTGSKWTTESSTWWVATDLYDSDAGGTGTHTTELGPKRSWVHKKRSKARFFFPAIPDFGDPDDPDTRRVYMQRGDTTPADSAFKLQATTAADQLSVTTPDFVTGAAPSAVNTFPGANPGYVQSSKLHTDTIPAFWVDGAGDGRWVSEDWHQVGAAGEPAFLNGFTALAGYPVRFHLTRTGVVYLVGYAVLSATTLAAGATRDIFILPAAYRPSASGPAAVAWKADMSASAQLPQIAIFPNGTVRLFNNSGSTLAAAAQIAMTGSWSVR